MSSMLTPLSRNQSGEGRWSDIEAEFVCPALKVAESAFYEEFFMGLLSGFNTCLAELEHAVDQAGEFVGSGIDSCRRPKTRFNATSRGSELPGPLAISELRR